jgi:hypothetical protein
VKTATRMAKHDDTQLLARLREGESEAFDTLVGRYHGRLLRLARLFVMPYGAAVSER